MKEAYRSTGIFAFVRAVEAGSFSAAARYSGTTPSAVSKVIDRLERQLQTKLFHRTTRTLSLTAEGAAYYERVAPLLRALEDAGEIFEDESETRGTLRISLPVAIAPLLVNALTAEFIVRHPAISLGISVTDRHVDLARDGFDFMLALGETRKEGATTCLSVNLPVALAAAPTYLARQGHPRSPAELGGAAHIRHLDADGPRPILFANGSMLTPAGIFDTDSIEAMRIGAVKGLGIASIPRILIEEDLHSGRLVEIVPHAPLAPVALHMSHCFGRFPPRRASLFAKFVQSLLMPRTASA